MTRRVTHTDSHTYSTSRSIFPQNFKRSWHDAIKPKLHHLAPGYRKKERRSEEFVRTTTLKECCSQVVYSLTKLNSEKCLLGTNFPGLMETSGHHGKTELPRILSGGEELGDEEAKPQRAFDTVRQCGSKPSLALISTCKRLVIQSELRASTGSICFFSLCQLTNSANAMYSPFTPSWSLWPWL